jgi:O-antigen/teichoic acid export membrane protein
MVHKSILAISANLLKVGIAAIFFLYAYRYLGPKEIGIFTVCFSIIGLVSQGTDLGFSQALVFKKNIDKSHYSSVFIFNAVLGLVIMGLLVSLIYVFDGIINQEESTFFKLLSLTIVSSSLINAPYALAQKKLMFDRIFIASFFSSTISAITGLICLYSGFGIQSLFIYFFVKNLVEFTILMSNKCLVPSLHSFSWSSLSDLKGYGSGSLIYAFLRQATKNIDIWIIGGSYGAEKVAIYNAAQKGGLGLGQIIISGLGVYAFPKAAKDFAESGTVRKINIQMIRVLAYIVSFYVVAACTSGSWVLETLLGEQWKDAAALMSFYPLLMLASVVNSPLGECAKATGKFLILILWVLIVTSISSLVLFVGSSYIEFNQMIKIYIVVQLSSQLIVSLFFIQQFIGVNVSELISVLRAPFCFLILYALLSFILSYLIPKGEYLLLVSVLIFGIILGFTFLKIDKNLMNLIRGVILNGK